MTRSLSRDKDLIKESLESVKGNGVHFENMPLMVFDPVDKGWRSIYLGVLSPYQNKYQKYVATAVRKMKAEKEEELKRSISRKQTSAIGSPSP